MVNVNWARKSSQRAWRGVNIFLGEDGGDNGVVSADGEVLPVEVRAPDCEGVNHDEEFLRVGGVIHLRGKELLACKGDGVFVGWSLRVSGRGGLGGVAGEMLEQYGSNGEVGGVSGDIEMATGVGDLEDRGRGDGLLEHYEEFIVPKPRAECGLMGVLLADTDVVEATAKVNLGEIFGSTKSIKSSEIRESLSGESDVVSSGSERVSRSREVNSSEKVVEVVSSEAMLWKKRGRGGADLGMIEVIVEVDKSGFDWGGTVDECVPAGVVDLGEVGDGATMVEVVVDEGGGVQVNGVGVEVEVVVTTVIAGEFPSSVVTRLEMAAMVVLMMAREDLRVVNVWRIVTSSREVVVEVG
ncbi:hypothetical protein CBR_g22878 [Chara braunii]|uniref:Uncharacterized protein n=1 Tax=Chara braunii TaxID=69332 RepID=A0A388L2Y5_CHABU|nr:hypothetical protein CBR_g22878 [Chara braunii]|eukprot:GBG76661.1 hypothetical protein CBR_g22878 [Chara braunii]